MARYSHRNSRRRIRRRSRVLRRSVSPKRTGGGYAFDLAASPIGGMAQVVPYNDYFFGGRARKSSKSRSRKSRRSPHRRRTSKK